MQKTDGSIDDDPGWEGLQAWVKPKIPQHKIRKWLAEKRERLELENSKIDGRKFLDQFAIPISPEGHELTTTEKKKATQRVPPKKKGSKTKGKADINVEVKQKEKKVKGQRRGVVKITC